MTPDVSILDSVAHLVVQDGLIVHVSAEVEREIGQKTDALTGPLDRVGVPLDDATFEDLLSGRSSLRLRLGSELLDRPVRLRRFATEGESCWIEVRSLAHEFRLESLLRRSGMGHMLISPDIELHWSIASNELADVFPGDNPLNWVELMDPDDMQALGKAIYKVGRDPNLRQLVRHRLNADRTYTILDTVESAMHDPDLRAVLVRSRLEDSIQADPATASTQNPYAGITVSDHMPIGVVVASTAGVVLHRNAVAARFLGARAGQLVIGDDTGQSLLASLPAEHARRFHDVFATVCTGQAGHCMIPSPLSEDMWLRISASPAAASTVVITIEDVTELSAVERALRVSNRLLEALDSHSEELVIVFDADEIARYTSSSVRRYLGPDAIIDRMEDFVEHVIGSDRAIVLELERRVRAEPNTSGAVEFRVETDDPVGRWHHATMTNLLEDPDVKGLVLTLRDIHERYLAERELRHQATHDALTTLPDRSALQEKLQAVLEEGDQTDHRTAVIFCDIDHFKQINDRLGHHAGDTVLTEVATRLRASVRTTDFVSRFGGDEFVVIVPNVDDIEHAGAVTQRLYQCVTGQMVVGGVHLDISLSMGVAVSDHDCNTVDELLQRADVAMYTAKGRGRAQFSVFGETLD
jgi:diguanylate cyclase (GGDEF)-like protein